jgi:beta-lactamase superfamily II metal-dependent hydrolase
MKLEIFDVEHGQCALLTGDDGTHMLIDCGHNSSTGWRPSEHLRRLGISHLEGLIITNYDEDHASDLVNLRQQVSIGILMRNPTVSGRQLLQLKSLHGAGSGIRELCTMTEYYNEPVAEDPYFGGLNIRLFYNSYPSDFTDENNLSLLSILTWPAFSIAFTGDLEVGGWERLLLREEVRQALAGVHVFMASHHGRANGYCEEIFSWTGMQPQIVVVSDSGVDYETQKTGPWYRAHATGVNFNGEQRKVITTRRDGTITFSLTDGGAYMTSSRRGPRLF